MFDQEIKYSSGSSYRILWGFPIMLIVIVLVFWLGAAKGAVLVVKKIQEAVYMPLVETKVKPESKRPVVKTEASNAGPTSGNPPVNSKPQNPGKTFRQPESVPTEISTEVLVNEPPTNFSNPGTVVASTTNTSSSSGGGGCVGPSCGSVLEQIGQAQPTLPPKPPVQTPKRITIGGNVQQAKLVRQVQPVYSVLAKQARISGVVHLSAVISRDGSIAELRVLSGPPLLVIEAMKAVQQWVYQPTLLNGEAVEVATFIDVNFTLSQ
jgi:protein TonB